MSSSTQLPPITRADAIDLMDDDDDNEAEVTFNIKRETGDDDDDVMEVARSGGLADATRIARSILLTKHNLDTEAARDRKRKADKITRRAARAAADAAAAPSSSSSIMSPSDLHAAALHKKRAAGIPSSADAIKTAINVRQVLWHNTFCNYKRDGVPVVHSRLNPNVAELVQSIQTRYLSHDQGELSFNMVENKISADVGTTRATVDRLISHNVDGFVPRQFDYSKFASSTEYNDNNLARHLNPGKAAFDVISEVNEFPTTHAKQGDSLLGGFRKTVNDNVIAALVSMNQPLTVFPNGSTATGLMLANAVCFVVCRDQDLHHTSAIRSNRPGNDDSMNDMLDASLGPNRVCGFGSIVFRSSAVVILTCIDRKVTPRADLKDDEFEFYHDKQGRPDIDSECLAANNESGALLRSWLLNDYTANKDTVPTLPATSTHNQRQLSEISDSNRRTANDMVFGSVVARGTPDARFQ